MDSNNKKWYVCNLKNDKCNKLAFCIKNGGECKMTSDIEFDAYTQAIHCLEQISKTISITHTITDISDMIERMNDVNNDLQLMNTKLMEFEKTIIYGTGNKLPIGIINNFSNTDAENNHIIK